MRTLKNRYLASLGLLAATVLLGATGCSGGGGSGGRGVRTQEVAADHVAAVLMVRAWVNVIYNRELFGAPPCRPSVSPSVPHGDGSVTRTYQNTDCSAAEVRVNRDGSMLIQMVTEDGNRQTIRSKPATAPGRTGGAGNSSHQFADGAVVGYQTVVDDRGTPSEHKDDHVRALGSFSPQRGARQQFEFERNPDQGGTAPLVDQLRSRVSNGGGLEMEFPITLRPSQGTDLFTSGSLEPRLDVARAIKGSFRSPSGTRLNFMMQGFRWTLSASNGITGSFQLQQGMEGAGNLMQDGKLVATIAWDREGKGAVTVLNGDVWTIGPSAAALEFLNHRWRLLLPSFGPTGGVASVR